MRHTFPAAVAAFAAGVCGLLLPATPAATIVFKDGFILTGRVIQQKKVTFESGVPSYQTDVLFMHIDDGVLSVILQPSPTQVYEVFKENAVHDKDFMLFTRGPITAKRPAMPFEVDKIGEWNARWERHVNST